ncbi:MAG: hypothetical protein AAB757_00165 [Patescibacteria group bacterium]
MGYITQNNFKKFVSIILLISFIATGFLLPLQYAKAVVPVSDIVHTAKDVAGWSQTFIRWIKEDAAKSLRDAAAKKFIDYFVDQTVQWIQGGGKPKFVGDWKQLLRVAQDIAFDTVISDIGLAGLCAPFKFSMKFALLPVKKFPVRIECTLDKVVKNINVFYNDFKQGNWAAFAASSQPQNNFYGQLVIANDELTMRIAKEQNAASNEAAAGSGFLSVKQCVQYDQQYIDSCSRGGEETAADCKEHAAACLKYQTMTPGDSVGKTVAKAMGAEGEWATNIQSWTGAIVNASINAFTKKFMKETGLLGIIEPQSADTTNYDSLVTTELDQQRQFYVDTINKLVNDMRTIKSLKEQTLDYAKQLIVVIKAILATDCLSSSETADYTEVLNQYEGDIDFSMGRLPIQIGALQVKIDEAVQVKNFILSRDNTTEQQMQISQTFNAFSSRFSEDLEAMYSGAARDAASAETTNFKTALDNQNTKLKQCNDRGRLD